MAQAPAIGRQDGRSVGQHGITSFTFVNKNATLFVTGSVNFYGNNGGRLLFITYSIFRVDCGSDCARSRVETLDCR